MGRSRPRPTALEGGNVRFNHPPPPRMNGLRDLSSSKWQDNKHSPSDVVEQYSHLLLMSEPEPSLDDRLVAPPPDWATCCVCHEVSLCSFSFNIIISTLLFTHICSLALHYTLSISVYLSSLSSFPPLYSLLFLYITFRTTVTREIFKRPTTTMCGHSFCYECIIEVIHRKGTCPLCRNPIGLNEITEDRKTSQAVSFVLLSYLSLLFISLT